MHALLLPNDFKLYGVTLNQIEANIVKLNKLIII